PFGRAPTSATLTVTRLQSRLWNDPLAAGTRTILGVTGILAAVLGLVGLILATRSALGSERAVLAEYEALGVSPSALRRTAQVRLLVLSGIGIAAGVAGGFLGVRLIGSF